MDNPTGWCDKCDKTVEVDESTVAIDEGKLILVCRECGHEWVERLEPDCEDSDA